jgi:hypothetical protein
MVLFGGVVGSACAIEKCQDELGQWHYADVAGAECSNAKVIILNDQGAVTGLVQAPKTAAQILVEEQERTRLEFTASNATANADEKHRILAIYETEAAIDRQRDNQMHSVQGNIDVHNAYLKSMDGRIARYQDEMAKVKSELVKLSLQKKINHARARVAESVNELTILASKKEQIMQKFAKEKELYRSLTNGDELID